MQTFSTNCKKNLQPVKLTADFCDLKNQYVLPMHPMRGATIVLPLALNGAGIRKLIRRKQKVNVGQNIRIFFLVEIGVDLAVH